MSACILCTTGKENLPSVRSSAKPLLVVYYVRKEISVKEVWGGDDEPTSAL